MAKRIIGTAAEAEPYLKIQRAEVILRLNITQVDGVMVHGPYEIEIENQWVKINVDTPRIVTSGKPIYRIDISSADKRIGNLLRVYKRVTDDVGLALRNPDGQVFSVGYEGCSASRNSLYVTGEFLSEKSEDEFPFTCDLSGGNSISGSAKESILDKRYYGAREESDVSNESRYLYLTDMSLKHTTLLLTELEKHEVLLKAL